MKIVPQNAFYKGVILPALTTIVVSSAIGFAIIDENLRPAFIQTVIIQLFQISGKPDERDK